VERAGDLEQQAKDIKAANTLTAGETGGITDKFTSDTGASRDIFNTNINQLLNTLRPTATRQPINLKMGNFETPFFSGSQRYAQGEFGDRNLERSTENTRIGELIKGAGLDQSALENLLTKQGVTADRDVTDQKFDMRNSIGNLINQIANQNLPNSAKMALYKLIQGQANTDQALNYGLPQSTTTQTATSDTSTTPSLVDTGVNVLGGINDFLR